MEETPEPRPLRRIRPPFSLQGTPAGLPRPLVMRARFVNPFSVPCSAPLALVPRSTHPSSVPSIVPAVIMSSQGFIQGSGSLQHLDDALRVKMAKKWVALAETLRPESEVLQSLPHLSGDQLLFLFMDRAASTLQPHMETVVIVCACLWLCCRWPLS